MHFTSLIAQATDSSEMFNSTSPATHTTNIGIFIGITLFVILIMIVAYAVGALLLGKIFKKAGVASWKAWVPIYNNWTLLEIGDQPGWWAILALIPPANIVSTIITFVAMHKIGLRLGKESWFVLLAIFVPIVWLAWLALDESAWNADSGSSPLATTPPTIPTWTPPAAS